MKFGFPSTHLRVTSAYGEYFIFIRRAFVRLSASNIMVNFLG